MADSGIYIEFVNDKDQLKKKFFDSTQYAINWGKLNCTNFNYKMIKYQIIKNKK